jgi:outer membrane murein-binding lipoprotein Lpp
MSKGILKAFLRISAAVLAVLAVSGCGGEKKSPQ